SIEEVAKACREWERRRVELDYEIDGIVIKVDSFDQQRRLGSLHQRPRWARAFKWAPMTATTRLLQIAIRVGRTGALNPWAVLEPVEVGGVTVSRATLHNEEDINRKEIREGDDVIVQRAGDVIPQIVGPAGAHRKWTKRFAMPTHCPLCGAKIVKPEGEVMHRCPNRACPCRGLEVLINWVEGFGPDRAESVVEWFAEDDNRRLVEELRAIGLRFEMDEEDKPVEGPLTGSQYVITGTLESMSREEAREALEALGAKVSDNVSKKTAGVFVGESPGSKVAKAQKAGVPLLDESELQALLQR